MQPNRSPETFLSLLQGNLASSSWNAIVTRVADDAVLEFPFHFPGRPSHLKGPKEIAEYFDAFRGVVRVDEMHIEAIHLTGDSDVVTVRAKGVGQGVISGIPFEPDYLMIFTLRDDLIVRWTHYFNPLAVLTALGGTFAFPSLNPTAGESETTAH